MVSAVPQVMDSKCRLSCGWNYSPRMRLARRLSLLAGVVGTQLSLFPRRCSKAGGTAEVGDPAEGGLHPHGGGLRPGLGALAPGRLPGGAGQPSEAHRSEGP